ncbi:hypothetical protein CDLVIII_2413 [Clostridium sp. DL-VIII]|uniref:AAA family ATPase n=1 Tax=Clostridium sp. DL-VIII TaxID=641107 RepID=UPI00023AFE8B|nr:AAA family ATPase [Clostridium sp. DL-VIII]EHI99058.1 hypothetical protein CDLVIII_2413 [Clostridium sp. DL-VIII]
MKYIVLGTNQEHKIGLTSNTAYLIEDQWDDWFKYSTMYDLWVVNENKEKVWIGKVKIGQVDMKSDQRRPDIRNTFNQLGEVFFSLGQDDYYYERIKELGDDLRDEILNNLNDMAKNEKIFDKYIGLNVTQNSLLRGISTKTVIEQFRRIAKGGARLTSYSFRYQAAISKELDIKSMELSFDIKPKSNPPTNIQVLIGRNGVGKTHLINNMINSIVNSIENEEYGSFTSEEDSTDIFSKVVFVSFSAFDEELNIEKKKMPYIKIGLPEKINQETLVNFFTENILECLRGMKKELLIKTLQILQSDPIFNESGIVELCSESRFSSEAEKEDFKNQSKKIFKRFSSGHKIIILTVATLIQTVEEKTLVFLDEPEAHLHPPLLASFVRALSELLMERNGVAIIVTHSPVILQEVPKKCVWKMRRTGKVAIAERLKMESFGENIASLTAEVFGLEVTHSGYHNLLEEAVRKYGDYDTIINKFEGQLGMEARAILKVLIAVENEKEHNQE